MEKLKNFVNIYFGLNLSSESDLEKWLSNKVAFFDNLKSVKRDAAAKEYRDLILIDCVRKKSINFSDVNIKIIENWSLSALSYIKEKAWVESIDDKTAYILIPAHNQFVIGLSNKNKIDGLGFSTKDDAEKFGNACLNA